MFQTSGVYCNSSLRPIRAEALLKCADVLSEEVPSPGHTASLRG